MVCGVWCVVCGVWCVVARMVDCGDIKPYKQWWCNGDAHENGGVVVCVYTILSPGCGWWCGKK